MPMLGQGCPTPEEKPLLELLLSGENLVKELDPLSQIGDRVQQGVNSLANKDGRITDPEPFPVQIDQQLKL